MKKLALCFAVIIFVLSYNSCTKDKVADVNCTPTDTVNTYAKSVKPIFDYYCVSGGCHDSGSHENGVDLETYDGSVAAVKSDSKFFCAIEHTCGDATYNMPQVPPVKLADSLITKIQLWQTNCYAQ